jgi:predicted 2-oxoglutarate/Fe(II)-dependent dioxygenase YbiX
MSGMLSQRQNKPDVGSPAPWFKAVVLDGNANYAFDVAAGRPIMMLFMGSASNPPVRAALDRIMQDHTLFDDEHCCFFGVTYNPEDAASGAIAQRIPGIRYILDYDRAVSMQFGACADGKGAYQPFIAILDRQLRFAGVFRLHAVEAALAKLRETIGEAHPDEWAPVLSIPRILEPQLCRDLIAQYEKDGGSESGFMRQVDGKTVRLIDHKHKRRHDYQIEDPDLRAALVGRINQRLRPAIQRAFQFDASRMERYIVACYDAEVGGHFRPHRDNTTSGTAHRRYAVTINLNAEEFEGGELRFPEYGRRTYRAQTGGAVVFSCGLLHEATPVTKGRRYAFLPFLYDDAAAQIREANNAFLGEGVGYYTKR